MCSAGKVPLELENFQTLAVGQWQLLVNIHTVMMNFRRGMIPSLRLKMSMRRLMYSSRAFAVRWLPMYAASLTVSGGVWHNKLDILCYPVDYR